MHQITVHNVNLAYVRGTHLIRSDGVLQQTRAGDALVVPEMVVTTYTQPCQRVLFDPIRDANPFFHFFEALWILDGQQDVKTLAYFNARMAEYSDNGETYHAAYGHRLRSGPAGDQIVKAISILKANPSSRQVVLQIWDAARDLGAKVKDVPCNDMVKLRIVDGKLDLTVFCRSNDMIWGAYGANAVQFSTLQEYLAGAIGCEIGEYNQISCDFHAYTSVFDEKTKHVPIGVDHDLMYQAAVYRGQKYYPMFSGLDMTNMKAFDAFNHDLSYMLWCVRTVVDLPNQDLNLKNIEIPYFRDVAVPMFEAYQLFKKKDFRMALVIIELCAAEDWRMACREWLQRRQAAHEAKHGQA